MNKRLAIPICLLILAMVLAGCAQAPPTATEEPAPEPAPAEEEVAEEAAPAEEGAALRIRYLLKRREKLREMGDKARQFVLENFLITRHLREYLTLMVAIMFEHADRIEPQ